uniref:Uncharacterized protein n=1 Tax=Glossina brevipalpis TaxID=37001 RepID=A0A1A9WMF0_9MUSC
MATKDVEKSASAFDELDFSSGFDTQYQQEYRPLKPQGKAPTSQDPRTLWYRDLNTIFLVAFLVVVYLVGTVLLTQLVLTTNALYVFLITMGSVLLAMLVIISDINTARLLERSMLN